MRAAADDACRLVRVIQLELQEDDHARSVIVAELLDYLGAHAGLGFDEFEEVCAVANGGH